MLRRQGCQGADRPESGSSESSDQRRCVQVGTRSFNFPSSKRFIDTRSDLLSCRRARCASYCQELWIEGDQAAAFFPRFFCGSICTPSPKCTPARTSGTSSAASTLRQG